MKNPFKPKHIGSHMLRWHVIPRNRWFNVYLHKIYANDDERALHDHPWWSFSIKLFGGELIEHCMVRGVGKYKQLAVRITHIPKRFCFRTANHFHRLEVPGKPVWTLFITGPYRKTWYFLCPTRGKVHYSHMTTPEGTAVASCDDLPSGVNLQERR